MLRATVVKRECHSNAKVLMLFVVVFVVVAVDDGGVDVADETLQGKGYVIDMYTNHVTPCHPRLLHHGHWACLSDERRKKESLLYIPKDSL